MPNACKKSTSAQDERTGHKKKQYSKRNASSSMIVQTSDTASAMSSSDAHSRTASQEPNNANGSSGHDTQYYLQGIGSQFDA
ncbi:hypothetical protein PG988_000035 [Apiospora saccharicola]